MFVVGDLGGYNAHIHCSYGHNRTWGGAVGLEATESFKGDGAPGGPKKEPRAVTIRAKAKVQWLCSTRSFPPKAADDIIPSHAHTHNVPSSADTQQPYINPTHLQAL